MIDTTVCMVTYRRTAQLAQILAALRRQDPPVRIWIWNNNPEPLRQDLAAVPDWLVNSSQNRLCPPRWWLAAQATTRCVLILDDDLLPATDTAVAKLVFHCQSGRLVGPFGATLRGRYRDRIDVGSKDTTQLVDVIKGRCMAGLTDTIREGYLWSGVHKACVRSEADYDDVCIAEDIAVSAAVSEANYGRHLVPAGIAADWRDLPEGPESLSRRADHIARRERVAARWFRD